MSAESHGEPIAAGTPKRAGRVWLLDRARFAWRFLNARFSSSLTRRIVVLNLGGLVVLAIGFLLLNQFRADIIAARIQSLTTQADIISAAIGASAAVDTDTITIDPEKLLQLAPGQSAAPPSDDETIRFSIDPEIVGPLLHRLVTPTHTRARIYSSDGRLMLDSRLLTPHGAVVRSDLPDSTDHHGILGRAIAYIQESLRRARDPREPRPLARRRQDDARDRRRAAGKDAVRRADQRRGRDDRLGRGADSAHDGDARGASAFDPGRRH